VDGVRDTVDSVADNPNANEAKDDEEQSSGHWVPIWVEAHQMAVARLAEQG
jgi:hypothetical protein